MNIWNKVFVGLIIFVSLIFFYFAAQVLKTHQYWRTSVEKHEKRIVALEDEIETLRFGAKNNPDQPGLLKMQSAVYKAMIGRGRVWYNCTPLRLDQSDPQKVKVLVKTDFPDKHGITAQTILAVFDEKAIIESGRYIGQFIVQAVGDEKSKQIVISSCKNLDPAMLQRLSQSRGPWTLCEIMPSDTHEIFAGMSREELERILPKDVIEEYFTDGKDGSQRQLRDYQFLFDTLDNQLSMLIALRNTAASDKSLMEAAVAGSKRQVQLRQDEIGELRKELAQMQRQRDIVAAHEKSLRKEVTTRTELVKSLLESNRLMAAEIARDQLEAVQRVDLKTASAE